MKISTVLGSALGVLLLFSVISYAQAYIQTQDPKPAAKQGLVLEVAGQIPETEETSIAANKPAEKAFTPTPAVAQGDTYSATAYSLRGRTASGQYVSRGLIAADPRFLPLGTRVRLDAGAWSGEYLVADTGGAIKGRKIDIWTPTSREALRFGRRPVKLTILSRPVRATKDVAMRPRTAKQPLPPAPAMAETNKQ